MSLRRLDQDIINKLLPHSSVASFAFCALELVKNSIDAGATVVQVDINCEQFSIAVTDNGCGLAFGDLQSVAIPHFSGNSCNSTANHSRYGFRGQTLANISGLSFLTIESSVTGEKPYMVSIHQSRRLAIVPIDITDSGNDDNEYYRFSGHGTRVTVRNIFANLPVRKKLLLENPNCFDLIQQELLPVMFEHNSVEFKLSKSGKVCMSLHNSSSKKRITQISHCLRILELNDSYSIEKNFSTVSIKGVIATRANYAAKRQHIFVNLMPVKDPSLMKEIEQLFKASEFGRLKKRFHNGKTNDECCSSPTFIFTLKTRQTLLEKVEQQTSISPLIRETLISIFKEFLEENFGSRRPSQRQRQRLSFQVCKPSQDSTESIKKLTTPQYSSYFNQVDTNYQIRKQHLVSATVIGQVDRKFILVKLAVEETFSTSPVLALIDQHAADERIQFDEQMKSFMSGYSSVKLITPISLHDSLSSSQISKLSIWGFKFFENQQVTHLPEILWEYHKNTDTVIDVIAKCLFDMDGSFTQFSSRSDTVPACPFTFISLITSKSCRTAIKFGEALTLPECRYIVSKLSACDNPFQCSHGRPSIIPIANISKIIN